jgi:hypothetical protein
VTAEGLTMYRYRRIAEYGSSTLLEQCLLSVALLTVSVDVRALCGGPSGNGHSLAESSLAELSLGAMQCEAQSLGIPGDVFVLREPRDH